MSTTSTIQIAPLPTTSDCALNLIQWMFANVGIPTDYNVGSNIRTYSEAVGSCLEIEGVEAQAMAFQAMVYSALSAFGISPLTAVSAVGVVTFSTLAATPLPAGQSVLIPANTIVQTTNGIQFATTSAVTLVSGTTTVNTNIIATNPGSAGNVPANSITQIATGLAYPLSVTNSAITAGGFNAETAQQTLTRFLAVANSVGLCTPIAIASCYDDQTEVLTDRGWRLFKNLDKTEKIATLNPDSHNLEYHLPSNYIESSYCGNMVYLHNSLLDLCVTPNHRMYICPEWLQLKDPERYRNKGCPKNWRFIEASEFKQSHRIKKDCIWSGEDVASYVIGDTVISMDLWLEFLGYFLSEGCTSKFTYIRKKETKTENSHHKIGESDTHYIIKIDQTKEPNRAKIRECLQALPYNVHESDHWDEDDLGTSFIINSKELYNELSGFGKAPVKFIPSYVKCLSSRQQKILFDALVLGDGNINKNGKTTRYSTTSIRLADDFQEMCLKIGYSASINKYDKQVGKIRSIRGKLFSSKHPVYVVGVQKEQTCPNIKHSLTRTSSKPDINGIFNKEYNGNVYCVEVPNNIIYVRRNGKTAWCGNSVVGVSNGAEKVVYASCIEPWIVQALENITPLTVEFNVAVDNGAGSASSQLLSAVTTFLSSGAPAGYRPAGVPFSTSGVIPVYCSVIITANAINPLFDTSLQTAISQATVNYFGNIGFTTQAELTQLTAAVANASFGQLTSLSVTLYDHNGIPQTVINAGLGQRVILSAYSVSVN